MKDKMDRIVSILSTTADLITAVIGVLKIVVDLLPPAQEQPKKDET